MYRLFDNQKVPLYSKLTGLFCYFGHHYIAIMYNDEEKVWTIIDDENIEQIGPHFNDVIQKCNKVLYTKLSHDSSFCV